jgi:hypothetical protein
MKGVQLHVSSRNKLSGSNTDFSVAVSSTEQHVKSLSLLSFSMPRLFTNINVNNNTICYFYSGVNHVLSIPVGQYSAATLVTALNLLGTVTWSLVNDVFVANASIATTIVFALSPLLEYMGSLTNVVCPLSTDTDLTMVPDLSGINEIYVCCTAAVGSCLMSSQRIPLVSLVPANVNYGSLIQYRPHEQQQQQVPVNTHVPAQLQTLFFQLVDNRGNTLIVPDNCYCSMLFKLNF